MSKKLRIAKKEVPTQTGAKLVVNELNVLSADRSRKDIGDFLGSLQAAENVYYPNRSRLHDLYKNIRLDGHLTGIIGKRIDAVLNKELHFQTNDKRVDEMDELIESEAFRNVIKKVMWNIFEGSAGMEFIPGEKFCFNEIPNKHIKLHKKIIAYDQSGEEGVSYDGVWNLWVLGDNDELGLLLKCAPYAIYKRGALADWSQYIEIFGQPVRVVYYDAYDQKTKIELKQVLDEAGSSLALMIPQQAKFEMMDGKQSNGDGKLQETFKRALDAEMSIIILGNTETTTSSEGSGYAQSKEHSKQQLEITKSDLKYVLNMLNSDEFFRILKSYGYPVEGGKFVYEKEIDLDFLIKRKQIDDSVSQKVPLSDDYWYNTYGLPKPDNYEELKLKMEKEKEMKLANPGAGKTALPPTKKPIKKKLNAEEPEDDPEMEERFKVAGGFLYRLRNKLADFFDPAPKS